MAKGCALSTGYLPRGGLPRNSVDRLTDCPDMTSAVDHGRKASTQTNKTKIRYILTNYQAHSDICILYLNMSYLIKVTYFLRSLLFNLFCISASCQPQQVPTGGDIQFSSDGSITEAAFSCSKGYTLQGVANTTCRSDGSWDYVTPTCGEFIVISLTHLCNREGAVTQW